MQDAFSADERTLHASGAKLANLARLHRAAVPVPRTSYVPAAALRALLADSRVGNIVAALEADENAIAVDDLERLQEFVLSAPLRPGWSSQLRDCVSRYGRTIVRSSALIEDGNEASFAGQFRSYLADAQSAELSLRHCWASLFMPSVIDYARRVGARYRPAMDALVQEWVEPRVSGVSFTSADSADVVTEAVYGHGELLVSGLVSPDRYVYANGEIDSTAANKLLAAVSADTRDLFPADVVEVEFAAGEPQPACVIDIDHEAGVAYVEPPLAVSDTASLSDPEARTISEMALQIASVLGGPVDVEWVLTSGGRPVVVQARAATRQLARQERTEEQNGEGIAAAAGVVTAPVFVARSPHEASEMPAGAILVATETTPDYMPALLRAAGVIVEKGGLLSHTSIVCRELGIPCLTDVLDATLSFQTGAVVTLDADRGAAFAARA